MSSKVIKVQCHDCKAIGYASYPPSTYAYCTCCGSTKIPDADKQAEHERRFWAGYRLTLELLDKERKRKEG